eukprot:1080816-Pyramimonas_sp.AAC.1
MSRALDVAITLPSASSAVAFICTRVSASPRQLRLERLQSPNAARNAAETCAFFGGIAAFVRAYQTVFNFSSTALSLGVGEKAGAYDLSSGKSNKSC